jgi:threonine synthase
MPERIPELPVSFFENLAEMSFQDMAKVLCTPYLDEDFSSEEIVEIIDTAVSFPAPLVPVDDRISSLELWHGPTLAFKDFGARFMAAVMGRLVKEEPRDLHILVATSGDTGGAVASGFLGIDKVKVTILYPAGKVSPLQEKQLTTLGQNIQALRVDGTFDDCQHMVKNAFLDKELNERFMLASANSINISRLIPQMFYYVNAYAQAEQKENLVIAVPSGNFGNLTAGLLAKRMGLPIHRFIAATNVNDIVPEYLNSGIYTPRPSVPTISNAMDVGNPSNFQRMLDLYSGEHARMIKDVQGFAYTDEQTKKCIREVHGRTGYVMDPHGAVAYLALQDSLRDGEHGILLETAHPAKFLPVMKDLIPDFPVPDRLSELAEKKSHFHSSSKEYEALKSFMFSSY